MSSKTTGVSRTSASPVTPVAPIASFAMRGEIGRIDEKWVFETCSGCFSATSSMSMPPMSLKRSTGFFWRPSQVTEAKYSWTTSRFSSTRTARGSWPLTSIFTIAS